MSFSDDIKALRLNCFMTQEQFANELGVTSMTVNRWEHNKSLPNLKVRKNIDDFCKRREIDFDIRKLYKEMEGNN